jgi:hypothetical protein
MNLQVGDIVRDVQNQREHSVGKVIRVHEEYLPRDVREDHPARSKVTIRTIRFEDGEEIESWGYFRKLEDDLEDLNQQRKELMNAIKRAKKF